MLSLSWSIAHFSVMSFMNLPVAIEDDWIRKSQKIQRKIYLYLLTHDQHIYLISVIVNLHLMVVFFVCCKGCGSGFIAKSFSYFWLGFAYQEPHAHFLPHFPRIFRKYCISYLSPYILGCKTTFGSIYCLKNHLLQK